MSSVHGTNEVASMEPTRESPVSTGPADAEILLRIASLAEQFHHQHIRNEALSSAEQIAQGQFYVACVGQFKRGKSTLLNALLGEPLLPSGVVPVTAVATIVRFGKKKGARVRLSSREWTEVSVDCLEEYVSEARNPENSKGVAAVEVFVPSPLLREGMCLVDTPGLGSTFAGNTAATHAFLPRIDAAVVVIGADPPISGEELSLVEMAAKQVSNLIIVLNKADRVTELERDAAVSFAREVLENRLMGPVDSIFEVSALEQLDGRPSARDWPAFLSKLELLAQGSGRQLVKQAARRSMERLSRQLMQVVREEREALVRPFDESEKRIDRLRELASQTEQSMNDLGYLFAGEQQKLSKLFGNRRDAFLKSVRATARGQLNEALAAIPRRNAPRYRRLAMQVAQDVARSHTLPWLATEETDAAQAYLQITSRFTESANQCTAQAHKLGGPELAYLSGQLPPEHGFRARSEFQFNEYITVAIPASPLRYVADLLLGLVRGYSIIARDAGEFLDLLLETNSERVRNDLDNRVAESRRRLETEIRTMLRELSTTAERALGRAREAHAAGAPSVAASIARLEVIGAELAGMSANSTPSEAR